jgi:hypothetical protein
MNKDELEKEIVRLNVLLEKERKTNEFLLKQQQELRKMAEKSGSEMSVWKHETIRGRERIEYLERDNKELKEMRK